MVFSHLKVVNSFTTIYLFYYELIHIHQDKSGKCWHARRFGSPSAGSEPRLYCISARPPPPQGMNLNQAR